MKNLRQANLKKKVYVAHNLGEFQGVHLLTLLLAESQGSTRHHMAGDRTHLSVSVSYLYGLSPSSSKAIRIQI